MRKLIFPLSLLTLWLAACSDVTDEPGEQPSDKDGVAMTFKVTGRDGAPETRMDYEGKSDEALKIIWDATTPDAIGLLNDNKVAHVKCEVISADGNKATFSDATLTWSGQPSNPAPVYAYYPYQSGLSSTYVPIDLSNQTVLYSDKPLEHIGDFDFMVATAEVNVAGTSSAQPLSLQFEHVLHLITFEVSGLSSDEIGVLKSITLKTTNSRDQFYTQASLDLSNPSYFNSANQFTNSVTLNLNYIPVESSKTYYFNMLVFPGVEMQSCDIIIQTDQSTKRISKIFNNPYNLKRGEHTLFDCTSGWEDVAFSGGNGTKDDPYLIGTIEDLDNLRTMVNTSTTPEYRYFKLNNDIELIPEKAWEPIGTKDAPFAGEFDGDGHTISNMRIEARNQAESLGFFGKINGATIKNLNVKGEISGNVSPGRCYAGGCVGEASQEYGPELPSITACSFNGNIQLEGESLSIGGIIGYSNGSIKINSCYYGGGELTATAQHESTVGGIIGNGKQLTMNGCYSLATKLEGNSMGGLSGTPADEAAEAKVRYCYWLHIDGVNGLTSESVNVENCSDFTDATFFTDEKINYLSAILSQEEQGSTKWIFVKDPNDGYPVIQRNN